MSPRCFRKAQIGGYDKETDKSYAVLDEDQALLRLRLAIKEAGSQREFAKIAGVSNVRLSHIVNGKRSLGGRVLFALGLRRETTVDHGYVRGIRFHLVVEDEP